MVEHETWEDRTIASGTGSGDHLDADVDADIDRAINLREAGELGKSLGSLQHIVKTCRLRWGRRAYPSQCALSQLGRTLRAMGRCTEASDLHWEVLAIRETQYGHVAMYTQNSASILVDTLRMLNDQKMAAAVELWRNKPDIPADGESEHAAESAKHAAIARVVEQLRLTNAHREAKISQAAAKLVDEYLALQRERLGSPAFGDNRWESCRNVDVCPI